MMFVHNVFMMFMNNILMMLMHHITMGLSHNRGRHVALNASCLSMRLYDCSFFVKLHDWCLFMNDDRGKFLIGGNYTDRLAFNLFDDRSWLNFLPDNRGTRNFFPNDRCGL
jgi:hypothetical protein